MENGKKRTVSNIVTQLLTGKDNQTHDIVRWLAVMTFVISIGLTIYVVVIKDKTFDIQEFGIAISTLFASVGAALKLKETTEPDAKPKIEEKKTDE